MAKPIAVQLYTVRDALALDFEGVVRKIAAMGYAGVETAGMFGPPGSGATAADGARLFKELGFGIASAHGGLPLGEGADAVFRDAEALGTRNLVTSIGPDQFATVELVKATCETLTQAHEAAKARDFRFCYHNHWWEFGPLGEQSVFDFMLEHLPTDFAFEIDIYWVQTGGGDAKAVLRRLGKRAPLIHVKDGPAEQGQPMTAVGQGKLDIAGILAEAGQADWLIAELDECATDMLTAVQESYTYLTGKGLADGK